MCGETPWWDERAEEKVNTAPALQQLHYERRVLTSALERLGAEHRDELVEHRELNSLSVILV